MNMMITKETYESGSAYGFVYDENGPGQGAKSSWPVIGC